MDVDALQYVSGLLYLASGLLAVNFLINNYDQHRRIKRVISYVLNVLWLPFDFLIFMIWPKLWEKINRR